MNSQDNNAMANIIVDVLKEHGFVDEKTGGYNKDNLPLKIKDLNSYILMHGGIYYVVEETARQRILGGGGYIAKKPNFNGFFPRAEHNLARTCELEKFYFLPEARGTGLAMELLNKIQETAIATGYVSMFLETEPTLTRAIHFYEKAGFKRLAIGKKSSVCMMKALDHSACLELEPRTSLEAM